MLGLQGERSCDWKNRKKPTCSGSNSDSTTTSPAFNNISMSQPCQPQQHRHYQHSHQQQSHQKGSLQLWRFLVTMLDDPGSQHLICWAGRKLEFKLNEPEEVARLWGIQKNRPTMNYDKLSRSLRYYYEKGIISKVSGERYVYRFAYEPEVLAKLTLDETLSSVLSTRRGENGQCPSPSFQDVVFPPPPPPPHHHPHQHSSSTCQSVPPPPSQIQSQTQPPPHLQIPVQEMIYQTQWEEQVVYCNNCEYEWSGDYVATDSSSYPTTATTTTSEQYDYAYAYEQNNQVYCTDMDADNYALFECPEYF
ncbi:ets variant locus tag 4 [Echinococcus multilocularis]|uniref:Ets variant locus tag 4 n=1 Tax=Echinococcus multilocularis TaxID=6211 RepID=A0A068XUL7_ECHMU|nr:ets variant locus tag 4 [Echinococcus multilocularis]